MSENTTSQSASVENNSIATRKFEFQHKNAAKPSIIHVILLNRTLRILLALAIFCILIPLADYFYFYSSKIAEYQIDDSGTCSHYPIYQIPCGSENATEQECAFNACCFSPSSGCYHFLPSKYQLRQQEENSLDFVPSRVSSPWGTKTLEKMKLDIQPLNDEILSIALWSPQHHPSPTVNENKDEKQLKYEIKVFKPELFIEIRRKLDNRVIFSTSRGALIVSENYFEWSFHLGAGVQLVAAFDTLRVIYGRRILINNGHSSVIPYVIGYDSINKSYHAVYFESIDSPAEVQILISNTIIIRQYASTSFKIKLYTGPSFEDIHRQLKSSRGGDYLRFNDAWPFGIHLCHYSAFEQLANNESEIKTELDHLLANIETLPFDSHCINADLTSLIMSTKPSMKNVLDGYETYVKKLRESDKKILLHLTLSAILIEDDDDDDENPAMKKDFFFKNANNDFSNFVAIHEKTKKLYFFDYISKAKEIGEWMMLEGQWLNNVLINNISDGFCLYRSYPFSIIDGASSNSKYLENLNFKPKNLENEIEQLIPLNVKLAAASEEPLIHQLNNYGRELTRVFQQTLNNFSSYGDDYGRKFCIVDSYREDSVGCGMLMRNSKPLSWSGLQALVQKSLFYSVTGMSFFGTEVCGGSNFSIAEDLCIRSYQFAIFTPLFYINSHKMPSKFTKYAHRLMLHAIRTRYSLLGYMQTCMSMNDIPLLRPLHFVYSINGTTDSDGQQWQFMFGDSLMIAPIVEPLVTELTLIFPETYFELWSGREMTTNVHFSIVMHDIPIFIRAGHIIALNLAHESMSIEDARMQPHLLVIALECTEKFTCHASGIHKIFLDRRLILEFRFEASENHLNITTTLITIADDEGGRRRTNPSTTSSEREYGSNGRDAICGPKPFASSEFRLAKIYGLGEFKKKYRNDYLSLNLNICSNEDGGEDGGGDWLRNFYNISI